MCPYPYMCTLWFYKILFRWSMSEILKVTSYQQKNVSWQVTFKTSNLTHAVSHLLDILAPNLLLFVWRVSLFCVISAVFLWVVMPCSLVGGYHRFRDDRGSTATEKFETISHGVMAWRSHLTFPSWESQISEFCNIFNWSLT
jgi:hypothetical protein